MARLPLHTIAYFNKFVNGRKETILNEFLFDFPVHLCHNVLSPFWSQRSIIMLVFGFLRTEVRHEESHPSSRHENVSENLRRG